MRPYETVYTTVHEVHSTSELNRVKIVYKSYGIVRDCPQVLHPTPGLTPECHTITVRFTRVHTQFHTIAIRPIRFKYESYMVKYGQTRSSTGIHGLTRPRTVLHGLYVCIKLVSKSVDDHTALEHNENHNYLLPPSTARSTRVLAAYFILECLQRRRRSPQGSPWKIRPARIQEGPPRQPWQRTRSARIQEGPSRPADHSNLLTLPTLMSWRTHRHYLKRYPCLPGMKVRKFMKPSHQNIHECVIIRA